MNEQQRQIVEPPRSVQANPAGGNSDHSAMADQLGALSNEVRGMLAEVQSQSHALNEAARKATGGQ